MTPLYTAILRHFENSVNTFKKITGTRKAMKIGLFGLFGAGDLGKTYQCGQCGAKF